MPDKEPAIIVDMDGTLALLGDRHPWKEMERCGEDQLCPAVAATVRAMKRSGYKTLIVTGRFEQYRPQTEAWLHSHHIFHWQLFMRADGDYRKDYDVKTELYHAAIEPSYNVLYALDDRDQSVACWRALGIPCFQVAPGNF